MTNHGINLRGKEPPNKPLSHSHTNDKRSQRSQTYHNTVTSSCLKAISPATKLVADLDYLPPPLLMPTLPKFSHFHVSHTSNNKRSQHFTSRLPELQTSGNYLPLPPLALLLVPLPLLLFPYSHISHTSTSKMAKHLNSRCQ